ncbi:MAG: hypothetical protein R2832_14100 [Rhodothermales bacterium]
MAQSPVPPPAIQQIIRVALVSSPLLFALLAFFVKPEAESDVPTGALTYAFLGLFLAVTGVLLLVIKPRRDTSENAQQRWVMNLVAWAAGEGLALFGVLIFFLGGPAYPAIIGIVAMAILAFGFFTITLD